MGANNCIVKVLKRAKDNTEKETVIAMTYQIVCLVVKVTLDKFKQHICRMGKRCHLRLYTFCLYLLKM